MNEWQYFWNQFPDRFDRTDFLRQVGKTFEGKPITQNTIDVIVSNIQRQLKLTSGDVMLDLCCGNGLLTKEIGKYCKSIFSLDYSNQLIQIAQKYHAASNIAYCNASVLEIESEVSNGQRFNKVYMYEALQHFTSEEFVTLLHKLTPLLDQNAILFFASVPDEERLWNFYNTPELKQYYFEQKSKGNLLLGTWWKKQNILQIARDLGFECEIQYQQENLYTAHYRFDFLLKK